MEQKLGILEKTAWLGTKIGTTGKKIGATGKKIGETGKKIGEIGKKIGEAGKKIGLIGKNRDNIEMNWMATGKCQAIKIDHPHFGLAWFTSLSMGCLQTFTVAFY